MMARLCRRIIPLTLCVQGACLAPTESGHTRLVAVRLAFVGQPGASVAGMPLATPIEVAVEDLSGARVPTAVSVSVTLGDNPTGDTLRGILTASTTNGVAEFSDLVLKRTGAGYRLVAKAPGLVSDTSTTFVVAPSAPFKLTFLHSPTDVGAFQSIAPAVQVGVVDSLGNAVATWTQSVVVGVMGPGGPKLQGTVVQPMANGVATFSDLSVPWPGKGFSLLASSGVLHAATSDSFAVSFTPDITFASGSYNPPGPPTNEQIYGTTASGSPLVNLTHDSTGGNGTPVWSPNGGMLAFVSNRTGTNQIFLLTADGTGLTDVSNNTANDINPVWFPSSQRLLFTSDRDGFQRLYAMNADGSGQTLVSSDSSIDGVPAVSPDGSKIIFGSSRTGITQVYTMSADGSGVTPITSGPSSSVRPIWSPRGDLVAYLQPSFGPLGDHLIVAHPDGSSPVDLTADSATTVALNPGPFSPDGNSIAFGGKRGAEDYFNVYVAKIDGNGLVNLTNNSFPNDLPAAWSPDGTKLLFTEGFDGPPVLWIVNSDGSGAKQFELMIAAYAQYRP